MDSSEHTDVTALEFLTERKLHKGDRQSDCEEADPVWDEEQGATPLIAEVREPPEVTQADTVADHSENESRSTQPSRAFCVSTIVSERLLEAFHAAITHL